MQLSGFIFLAFVSAARQPFDKRLAMALRITVDWWLAKGHGQDCVASVIIEVASSDTSLESMVPFPVISYMHCSHAALSEQ